MIITANEARRLMRTRWQAELSMLNNKISEAIYNNETAVFYTGTLFSATIEYLKNAGYYIVECPNSVIISWEEKE